MRKSLLLTCTAMGLSTVSASMAAEPSVSMTSPDGQLTWTIEVSAGCRITPAAQVPKENTQTGTVSDGVRHILQKDGSPILFSSDLGLVIDGKNLNNESIKGVDVQKTASNVTRTFPTRGKYPQGKVTYNEYKVTTPDSPLIIQARIYNNGVAFRYDLAPFAQKKSDLKISDETTSFHFTDGATLWTQDANSALGPCEGVWSPSSIQNFKKDTKNPRSYIRTAPITAELPSGHYAVIQEAGNFEKGWSGIKWALYNEACHATYFQDPKGFSVTPDTEMPWRVILVDNNLNDLVHNDIIDSLSKEHDHDLFPQGYATPWIQPGHSSWTWWDSTRVLEQEQYPFVDMASEFGWKYHLVDEGWKKWAPTLDECIDRVAKLAKYAANKGVGIWVWVRWVDVNNPADNWATMQKEFKKLAESGVKGIKIDFMDSASQDRLHFYDAVARFTAENKLMVNFHGANTPTGEPTAWPHEMSREAIFGGEQNIWGEVKGEHYTALPFTRYISGHADFTGGYFGHGPKLRGSSWSLQLAANIIYTSPIMHWVSNPKDMNAAFPKGSLQRKALAALPTTWDETLVLPPSKIGDCVVMARRSGENWFLAVINGDHQEKDLSIKLDFLKKGHTYDVVTFRDLNSKNDGWDVASQTSSSGDEIKFSVRKRGGGVAWLAPTTK